MPAPLSRSEVDAAVDRVRAFTSEGDAESAWAATSALRLAQRTDAYAASSLVELVSAGSFSTERALELVRDVLAAHEDDEDLLGALGSALENAVELRFLNAPPPSDPAFRAVAERLRERARAARGTPNEATLVMGLATAARLLGHAWDDVAESAYRRVIEIEPDGWAHHYDLGLFLKVRGRFAEGMAANRAAASLGGDDESVRWNLGICATGARDGAAALAVWKELGQKIALGRFGLPEGGYHSVKARLAERPVAERGAADDHPGLEETIWIERLSPCHGVVRSALVQELGVEYGDVVLFDGAPVTHQTYGDARVPVFPHLATLVHAGYRVFPFVGTQPAAGALMALSKELPEDAVLYSHTEQFVILCAHCWDGGGRAHGHHPKAEHHVVRGKLCVPPSVGLDELRRALDAAVEASGGVRVFVPELSRLLGDHARADVEARRMAMVTGG